MNSKREMKGAGVLGEIFIWAIIESQESVGGVYRMGIWEYGMGIWVYRMMNSIKNYGKQGEM
jgi:hypothetical protein